MPRVTPEDCLRFAMVAFAVAFVVAHVWALASWPRGAGEGEPVELHGDVSGWGTPGDSGPGDPPAP